MDPIARAQWAVFSECIRILSRNISRVRDERAIHRSSSDVRKIVKNVEKSSQRLSKALEPYRLLVASERASTSDEVDQKLYAIDLLDDQLDDFLNLANEARELVIPRRWTSLNVRLSFTVYVSFHRIFGVPSTVYTDAISGTIAGTLPDFLSAIAPLIGLSAKEVTSLMEYRRTSYRQRGGKTKTTKAKPKKKRQNVD